MALQFTINPKYEALRSFITRIPQTFNDEGEEIYNKRNIIKVMTLPDGQRVNVKRYHRPAGPNLLVYSWGIRKPKCERAFDYPRILLENGIDTPEPIACIEERNGIGLLGYSYFISAQRDNKHTMYEMANAGKEEYEPMAKAIATFAADMHDKGILHKDFTPGNILWSHDSDGYHFLLVDINRMFFGNVTIERGLANMCRLWGPKDFIILLARHYASARHGNEEEAIRLILKERKRFWTSYLKRHPGEVEIEF